MTISSVITIDGHVIEVVSDSATTDEPCIIIPVSLVTELDSGKIGDCAKGAIDEAWYIRALREAYDINLLHRDGMLKLTSIQDGTEALLAKYKFSHASILDALIHLQELRAKAERAKPRPRSQRQRDRAEIQSQYGKLFVKLGRRDGFRCAACRNSDPDLQIDHIRPLAKGGTNDLTNLQLLCAACNAAKGDSL